MRQRIIQRISEIEQEHNIQIFYAVESGSRAWGFASYNSDYDIRFIFHRKIPTYLKLSPSKDTIDLFDENLLDFHGWDIYKAGRLFLKFNPSMIEWLFSPVVYVEKGQFVSQLRNLANEYFSAKPIGYHYYHIAKKHYLKHLQEAKEVKVKVLLYILRSLFCFQWVERKNTPPPLQMEEIMQSIQLQESMKSHVCEMIEQKKFMEEKQVIPMTDSWKQYLESELHRVDKQVEHLPSQSLKSDWLDPLILDQIGYVL